MPIPVNLFITTRALVVDKLTTSHKQVIKNKTKIHSVSDDYLRMNSFMLINGELSGY